MSETDETTNAVDTSELVAPTTQSQGTLAAFYSGSTGKIIQSESNAIFYFYQSSARNQFQVGELVDFSYVTLPPSAKGTIIVKNVTRK